MPRHRHPAQPENHPPEEHWIPGARAVPAEGARVGFMTCTLCGVSVMIDPATPFDVIQRHEQWHASMD
jgi:hypothetical protein